MGQWRYAFASCVVPESFSKDSWYKSRWTPEQLVEIYVRFQQLYGEQIADLRDIVSRSNCGAVPNVDELRFGRCFVF